MIGISKGSRLGLSRFSCLAVDPESCAHNRHGNAEVDGDESELHTENPSHHCGTAGENSCNGYRCGNLAEQVWKLGSALSIMVFGAAFIQDKLSS